MAKFIYSMQNVLNIKERMETQAKTEYAQMLGALHDEENRMRSIVDTLNSYKAQAKALASGKLDIAKIRRCNEAIEITEDMVKNQAVRVRLAEKNVVWVNKDTDGKYINTKEVIFTVCRAASTAAGKKDNVRYTQTVVNTNSVATGINNVTVDNAKNGVRYNLAGQRVTESYKGVVIENGKKMIVK